MHTHMHARAHTHTDRKLINTLTAIPLISLIIYQPLLALPKKLYESISEIEGHIQHIPLDDGDEDGPPEHTYM